MSPSFSHARTHQDERAFSAEEEEKLQAALQLEAKDLELVLDTTSFILQQAAYHLAKPSVLGQHLQNIGLEEDKVHSCFSYRPETNLL